MSQNKNIESLSTLQRVGAVAALAGAFTMAHTVAPEHTNGLESPVTISQPGLDTLNSPAHGFIDKAVIDQNDSAVSTVSPYHKSIKLSLPSARPIAPPVASLFGNRHPSELDQITSETTVSTAELFLNPESWTIPDKVTTIMDRDVTYITTLGCSGSLVRDKAGEAIGLLTAEHCSLRGSGEHSTQRQLGQDGISYIVTGSPLEAMTGPDKPQLISAGTIEEFFVPAADDNSSDIAIGVLSGHTAQEVLAAYNHNKLSANELAKLTIGDRMYVSGWPIAQPKDNGIFERQNFPLAVLGSSVSMKNAIGQTLDLIWAAVPVSKDGAVCSYGDSGAEGFIMEDGHSRAVGTLSVFEDFTGKIWGTAEQGELNRKFFEDKYGVDLSGFSAVCGFSSKTPDASEGGVVIKPVLSSAGIPGYAESHSPEILMKKARESFLDPTFKLSIVDGIIGIDGGKTVAWKDRPIIFYDPATFSVVLGSYNPDAPDNLELDYFPSLSSMSAFPYETAGIVPILTPDGEVRIDPSSGAFVDRTGLSFGKTLDQSVNPDLSHGLEFSINPNDNTISTYDQSLTMGGK